MLQTANWIVEYSSSKKDFQINELIKSIEDNLNFCLQGVSSDYQVIGVFTSRQTARIFCEGVKACLVSGKIINENTVNQDNLPSYVEIDYEEACLLVQQEIKQEPRGFIRYLCTKNKLTFPTVVNFLNDKIKGYKPMYLVLDLLLALNYDPILKVDTEVDRDQPDGHKETITYKIRKIIPDSSQASAHLP